jgi:hypothetical protein
MATCTDIRIVMLSLVTVISVWFSTSHPGPVNIKTICQGLTLSAMIKKSLVLDTSTDIWHPA